MRDARAGARFQRSLVMRAAGARRARRLSLCGRRVLLIWRICERNSIRDELQIATSDDSGDATTAHHSRARPQPTPRSAVPRSSSRSRTAVERSAARRMRSVACACGAGLAAGVASYEWIELREL